MTAVSPSVRPLYIEILTEDHNLSLLVHRSLQNVINMKEEGKKTKKTTTTKLQVSKLKSVMASLGRVGVCPVHHHSRGGEKKLSPHRHHQQQQLCR